VWRWVFYRIRQKIIPSTSIGLACRAISGIYNVYNRCFGWCFDREFFNPYVQLSGGLTVDHKNTGAVCIEYGSTYKWFDIALAADYESNSLAKEYTGEVNIFRNVGYDPSRTHNEPFAYFTNTSLQLVGKVDLVRLLVSDSPHSLKVGGGYGLVRYQKSWSIMDYPDDSSLEYTLTTKSYLGMLGSFKVSYEYQLTPKMVLGTYFGGTFYPSIGLLIRGNI
jgi:hypothetical protein